MRLLPSLLFALASALLQLAKAQVAGDCRPNPEVCELYRRPLVEFFPDGTPIPYFAENACRAFGCDMDTGFCVPTTAYAAGTPCRGSNYCKSCDGTSFTCPASDVVCPEVPSPPIPQEPSIVTVDPPLVVYAPGDVGLGDNGGGSVPPTVDPPSFCLRDFTCAASAPPLPPNGCVEWGCIKTGPGLGTCGLKPKAKGTVCRASTGVCDPAETCPGDTNFCPPDVNDKCPVKSCIKPVRPPKCRRRLMELRKKQEAAKRRRLQQTAAKKAAGGEGAKKKKL